ncbi:CpaF family protein [Brevibacillus dissolubilis]|uniref:CpaF family protein n=1 Tax=Brevibacillus dissolubilis TaxID=1844116 RepID=UPI001116F4A3|nr:ATPase, T2SS/T4P/T4SS family [Brevibacillus dissolubilis]
MTFSRKSLLGLGQQTGRQPIDLRHTTSDAKRAQQKAGGWLHDENDSAHTKPQHLTSDQSAQVKKQMVEKYGRKLWEEKADPAFLHEISENLRLLIEAQAPLTTNQIAAETHRLLHELTGWGPLDELLDDDDITEILVHRHDYVVVERKSSGRLEPVPGKVFHEEPQLLRLIEQIAATMGREFNETKAECNTQLPDGSRIAATHRSISPDGHMLTIRKHRDLLTEADYLRYGSVCQPMLTFLQWAIGLARCSGLVSGGTGSGKTHLLNLLSQYIPKHLSAITIEDVLELKLQHPYVRRFLAKPPNHEGKGGFSIRDCVRLSLRKRPDVIIVGESRGGEIIDMLWAMNTDHPGSWSTAHANSPRALVDSTLPILFGKADETYNTVERNLMIGSALDLIVQVKRFEEDGSRKIVAITEVVGTGESHEDWIRHTCGVEQVVPHRVYLQDIFVYEPLGVVDGRVTGQFKWTGYMPERLVQKWRAKGLKDEQLEAVFFADPIRI